MIEITHVLQCNTFLPLFDSGSRDIDRTCAERAGYDNCKNGPPAQDAFNLTCVVLKVNLIQPSKTAIVTFTQK